MKLYKLTNENGQTHGGCQWGEGITHSRDELLEGDGPLCSGYWYHAYVDPVLAVLMNPAHANFDNPRLWEAEGEPDCIEPDKVGTKSLTTIREVDLPDVTVEQRVKFGILASMKVFQNKGFMSWAEAWLSGEDRTAHAARHAAAAAAYATDAAYAARAAVDAARHAAYAAAYDAAYAAARHAAAAAAADAACDAARAAVDAAACGGLDLVTLAHQAVEKPS